MANAPWEILEEAKKIKELYGKEGELAEATERHEKLIRAVSSGKVAEKQVQAELRHLASLGILRQRAHADRLARDASKMRSGEIEFDESNYKLFLRGVRRSRLTIARIVNRTAPLINNAKMRESMEQVGKLARERLRVGHYEADRYWTALSKMDALIAQAEGIYSEISTKGQSPGVDAVTAYEKLVKAGQLGDRVAKEINGMEFQAVDMGGFYKPLKERSDRIRRIRQAGYISAHRK